MVYERQGMAAPQGGQGPLLQRLALDLYVEYPADAVGVGGVRAGGARMALEPAREVVAQGLRIGGKPIGLFDRALGVSAAAEGSEASVPGGLGDAPPAIGGGVAGDLDNLP